MSNPIRSFFSNHGSFLEKLIDVIDDMAVGSDASGKNPFKRVFIFEPLEERIALNADPAFVNLPDEITVIAGQSYHIALNATDADNDALNYTATTENTQTTLSVLDNAKNASVRMHLVSRDANGEIIEDYGYITIELFQQDAPNTTKRIKQLIEAHFYEGLSFHRIIDGFMIQGGDPDGDGTGGSGQTMLDEFSTLLRHNSAGIVSMANSGQNTGDSQFFITDAATIWLDDKHSIFGFMTSGYDTYAKVIAVETDGNNRPLVPVLMEEVELFTDTTNGVLRIQTDASAAGTSTTMTVTVDDGHGGTIEKEVKVNIIAGTLKEDPPVVQIKAGESQIVELPGINGLTTEQLTYLVNTSDYSDPSITYEIIEGNKVKITVGTDVSGPQYPIMSIKGLDDWVYINKYLTMVVTPAAPRMSWTDGDNGTAGDGITSNNNKDDDSKLTFTVEGVIPKATLNLYANGVEVPFKIISDIMYDDDGQVITAADGSGIRTLVIETVGSAANKLNDGNYKFTIKQTSTPDSLGGAALVSDLSTPVNVVIATVAPEFLSPLEGFEYDAEPGKQLVIPITTNKDGEGSVKIEVVGELPVGMTLSEDGRTLTWDVPADAEVGTYEISLKATDGADNTRTVTFKALVQNGPQFVIDGNTTADEETDLVLELKPLDDNTNTGDTNTEDDNTEEGDEPLTGDLTYEVIASTLPEGASYTLVPGEDGRSATFTWHTTEADGPGTYTITFQVKDENGNVRRKMVQVTVNEVNKPPYFDSNDFPESFTVREHELLSVLISAHDDDIPKNALTYSFVGEIRDGMSIDPATGRLTWTPGELDGGNSYRVTIQVADESGAKATFTVTIDVEEVDEPPVFTPVDPVRFYDDLGVFRQTVHANDPDVPTNAVRYSLVGDVPRGMTINAETGEIVWVIPKGFLSSAEYFRNLNVQVKATEIQVTIGKDENDNPTDIETEGLFSIYTVVLQIYSRGYEAMAAAQSGSGIAFKPLNQPGLPVSGINAPVPLSGTFGIGLASHANFALETPLYDKDYDTRFRDRFSSVTFGIEPFGGGGEVVETSPETKKTETQRTSNRPVESERQEREQPQYRNSNRPVSPSALLRSLESGFARVNSPFEKMRAERERVQKTVFDLYDAGQELQSGYYDAIQEQVQKQKTRDAAILNWNNDHGTAQGSAPSANQGISKEKFNAMRLQ